MIRNRNVFVHAAAATNFIIICLPSSQKQKMPTNVYRIQGPDGAVPYQQYLIEKDSNKLSEISTALMKDVRCDGRGISTHRNLCKILIVTRVG